jgi:hypothetical protein
MTQEQPTPEPEEVPEPTPAPEEEEEVTEEDAPEGAQIIDRDAVEGQ